MITALTGNFALTTCTGCGEQVPEGNYCFSCGATLKRISLDKSYPDLPIFGIVEFFNLNWSYPSPFPTAATPQHAWNQFVNAMRGHVYDGRYAVVLFKPADSQGSTFDAMEFYLVEKTDAGWQVSTTNTGASTIYLLKP